MVPRVRLHDRVDHARYRMVALDRPRRRPQLPGTIERDVGRVVAPSSGGSVRGRVSRLHPARLQGGANVRGRIPSSRSRRCPLVHTLAPRRPKRSIQAARGSFRSRPEGCERCDRPRPRGARDQRAGARRRSRGSGVRVAGTRAQVVDVRSYPRDPRPHSDRIGALSRLPRRVAIDASRRPAAGSGGRASVAGWLERKGSRR